jgi:hypothetical protein
MVYDLNIDVKNVNLSTLICHEQKWNLHRGIFFVRLYEYVVRKLDIFYLNI